MDKKSPTFDAGANQLTRTLQGMMKGIADKPPQIDFGKINGDLSLTTNSFPKPIPKTDYSVCRSVLYSQAYPLTETLSGTPKRRNKGDSISIPDGKHAHDCGCHHCVWGIDGAHRHWTQLPLKMRRLQPGDKVLVAWIQNEACVIDIVYSAKYLGSDDEPDWT